MGSLTREQIREIDRQAIENFGIPSVVLMENAGRNAAQEILKYLDLLTPLNFCILCGGGNNGGDGFVIARHLYNKKLPNRKHHQVEVVLLAEPDRLTPDAKINYNIADKMGISIFQYGEYQAREMVADSQVIIDALLGTGFSGEMREPFDQAIHIINDASQKTIVAIDVPSGLDCNTGQPATPTIRANLTITFVAHKAGFDQPPAKDFTGRVFVADIGAPRELLDFSMPA